MNNASRSDERRNEAAAPAASSDKKFGLVFSLVFAFVGLYPMIRNLPIRVWALGLAMLFLVTALARPGWLSPLNRMWTKLGLALHHVVSPIALFVVFCVAVLPTGLLLRALRKDLLRLRFEPESATYWIERRPPGRSDEQMKKQF